MSDRDEPVTPGTIGMLVLVALLPGLVLVLGFWMLPFLLMPMLFVITEFLDRGRGSPPGPSGPDGGGADGPRGPHPPDAPRGGLPLPDADPGRVRLRDHDRPDRAPVRRRGPAREPVRQPERSPHRL